MASYQERKRIEMEDEFIRVAVKACTEKQTWSDFLGDHPEYRHREAELKSKYEQMAGRSLLAAARKDDSFSLQSELDAVRSRRAREAAERFNEDRYQENRKALLDAAYAGKPWSQVQRENDLGPDEQKLYERAKNELGYEVEEKPDPREQVFLDGFFF